MRLLHVTSSLKIGGAETLLCDLIERLDSKKFDNHVIYFHSGPKAELLRSFGVKLYHVKGIICLYDPFFFMRLFRTIKKIRPDCIHSLLWSANISSRLVAWLLSIDHISVYHNNIKQDGIFRNFIDRMSRRFSSRLVAVSDEVSNSIGSSQVIVIKNGIDSVKVRKISKLQKVTRKELGFSQKDFVIGSVGRFCTVKNYSLLIESFYKISKQISNSRLVLVGIGPDEKKLRHNVDVFGLRNKVRFVVGKSSYGYLPLFDCFVQSSDKEGISIALLEALSCGIVCVSTNLGAKHSVLINNKNGLVVPAGNVIELTKAIYNIANNSRYARKLALAGLDTVKKDFSINQMIYEYENLFFGISNSKY